MNQIKQRKSFAPLIDAFKDGNDFIKFHIHGFDNADRVGAQQFVTVLYEFAKFYLARTIVLL